MKAWTLIGFYLLKDIWKRWFETPGGALSRLLVAFILAMLLLVVDSVFTLTAASIQGKISRMGVRTIVLTRSVPPSDAEADGSHLFRLVSPLRDQGQILRLMRTPSHGEDELGSRRTVYVYGREMLRDLAPAPTGRSGSQVFVVTEDFPVGMATRIRIDNGPDIPGTMISPPSWLTKFGADSSAILVPEEQFPELTDKGFFELVVFLGDEDCDLRKTEGDLTALFAMEDLGGVQLTSPRELLSQLDELETTQRRWRGGFGLFGGLAVSLVFGSISILEYRQNRYIIALLKSFGAPYPMLAGRYLMEALLITCAAALLARSAAAWLHPVIFDAVGTGPQPLELTVSHPYPWHAVWLQMRWLGFGAFLSVLPVAFAMRTPVGRILA